MAPLPLAQKELLSCESGLNLGFEKQVGRPQHWLARMENLDIRKLQLVDKDQIGFRCRVSRNR